MLPLTQPPHDPPPLPPPWASMLVLICYCIPPVPLARVIVLLQPSIML